MIDRYAYAELSRDEIKRRLQSAEDRQTRADTTEAALADAYAIQELYGALSIQTSGQAKGDD